MSDGASRKFVPQLAPAEAEGGAHVELEAVSKSYPSGDQVIAALRDVSLVVAPGSIVAVQGPSGSGKSTLLHVVGAMEEPTSGRIRVGRYVLNDLRRNEQAAFRRRVGFVFQRFHLLPALTALDNVAAPLFPYKTRFDKHARGRALLAAVGLSGREDALPSKLSGGQQQRVALARALVNDPFLLLADEPTGNLDSDTGGEILDLLLDLRAQRGMTVLVATHDPLVAARCDRIVRLLDGEVRDDVAVARSERPQAVLERISRFEPLL